MRDLTIEKPAVAGAATAPARGFSLRSGVVVPFGPRPVQQETTSSVKKISGGDVVDFIFGATNAASEALGGTPLPALSEPHFEYGNWKWHPRDQTAVSAHFGRYLITGPLFVQALSILQRLSVTFTRADAASAAKYLDAAKADLPMISGSDRVYVDPGVADFHLACTRWLGSKLEKAGFISKGDAASKSGTDPAKWKDPSDLGSNVSFLDTLYEQVTGMVKPLSTALGVSAGIALLGVAFVAYLALKR